MLLKSVIVFRLLLLISVMGIGVYVYRTGKRCIVARTCFMRKIHHCALSLPGRGRARFEASAGTVGWAMIYHAGGCAIFDSRRFAFWIPRAPSTSRVVDDAFLSRKERDHYCGARHQ